MKKGLVLGIIALFIVSAVSPMVIGYGTKSSEKDEYLENLAFVFSDDSDSSKFAYYKKLLQRDDSWYVESEEVTIPVESSRITSAGPMDSPWPMKCHDLHHTSRSPYSTANVTGLEKWRFKADGWVQGGPIIDNDGTIYFGDFHGYLYAIYPDGTLKWKYKTGGSIWSTPAIAEDGTTYVTSYDDFLHAVNYDGTLKWKFSADDCSSSPAIAQDGTIYFGVMGPGNNGRIFAVNPNGTEKWHYDTSYWIVSDPATGDDGTIYIGSGDSYLYAMNPNGTLKWRFKTGDIVKSHPSIADDGTIYFGSFDGYLYALYPNGTMKWKFNNPGSGNVAAVIAEDGTLYLGGDKLYAIYPNGTLKWSFNLGTKRRISHSSPAISADETIYVGTHVGEGAGGEIIAVNPDGTERWRKLISDAWVDSSPSIGEDGTVYIGSTFVVDRGYIHAFGPVESNSPPDAPSISGTINGKVGEEYWYSFRAVDPDNNPVSYYVDWGDDTSGWVGTRASGELCYFSHEWFEKGTYNISAKVKDVMGEESDWAYLEVTMPMNQQLHNWWFLQFLQNHPRMFPIIRWVLGPIIDVK